MLGFGFVLPFLALYVKQLGVSSERAVELWSGILVASTAVALAVAAPVWGSLSDRHGRKLMVLRAMLLGGLILALTGFVVNVYQFLALRVLQGVFTGTVAASTALVATICPRERIAYSVGLLQTSIYAGISGGPLLGGLIAQALSIRGTFVIGGLLLMSAGAVVWLLVHEHYPPPIRGPRPGFMQGARRGLSTPGLPALLTVLFLVQLSSAIIFPILPLFVEQISQPGAPVNLYSGLAFGATSVTSALAAVGFSRLVSRSGYRWLLIGACLCAAALFAPQALARRIDLLLLLRAGVGVFFGVLIPATNAMIGLATPGHRRGSAYGLTSSATALGNAVGPLLGSGLAAAFGLSAIFLGTAGILALLSLWIALLVPEPPASGESAR
jgi:DHA1 family multidrug resistance protein-like MFS transporter